MATPTFHQQLQCFTEFIDHFINSDAVYIHAHILQPFFSSLPPLK